MPENDFNSYQCYIAQKRNANNCVINTPSGKNVTCSSEGVYIQTLYCSNSCGS